MDKKTLKERVVEVLEKIRPVLQADGGDIELDSIDEDKKIVYVKFRGGCVGCMGSQLTLQFTVGEAMKKSVPEIKQVKAVN